MDFSLGCKVQLYFVNYELSVLLSLLNFGFQRIFILSFVHIDVSAAQHSPSLHLSSDQSTALHLAGQEKLGVQIRMHVG